MVVRRTRLIDVRLRLDVSQELVSRFGDAEKKLARLDRAAADRPCS